MAGAPLSSDGASSGGRWARASSAVQDRLFASRFVQQYVALLHKNALVAWRCRRSTSLRLLAPFLFLLLALLVNAVLNANYALQERFTAVEASTPRPIGPIPDCGDDLYIAGRPCVTFVWSPSNDTRLAAIVGAIRANNAPPIPASRVLGFTSRGAADEYMAAHPDGALGALHFVRSPQSDSLRYLVATNSTVKYFKGVFQDPLNFFQLPFINAVARELSRSYVATAAAAGADDAPLAPDGFVWAPRMAVFPHPSLQSTSLLAQVLSSFVFAALMFGFVTQMSALVGERDGGLRLALANMGMRQAAYWTSWMSFDAALNLAAALVLVLSGMALQFGLFLRNDFIVLLLLFWLFSLAMTSFGYLLSTFVRKAQGAMYLGFAVFIVGWVFQSVIFLARLPYTPATYFHSRWGPLFFWVFSCLPWNPLTKGILDLNAATLAASDPGLRAHQLSSYCSYVPDGAQQAPYDPRREFRSYDCIYPLWQVYVTLLVQWAAYWAAAVYLGNVLPDEVGRRRPWFYWALPAYWRPRATDAAAALQHVMQQEAQGLAQPPPQPGVPIDAGVAEEEARMRRRLLLRAGVLAGKDDLPDGQQPQQATAGACALAAELFGLRKVFRGRLRLRPGCMRRRSGRWCCWPGDGGDGGDELSDAVTITSGASGSGAGAGAGGGGGSRCCSREEDFWAVRGSWLGIERGRLFCLLGPNGAGKSTTINCLTGVLPYSGGDAIIYGTSISSEGGLDAVRPLMGVCPQFDVLWPELTGREHLAIAGHVKGLHHAKVAAQADELLARVQLDGRAATCRSDTYSGGMKRRLSVALALLGDPQIVYLDEPTTGMDPISRRAVWDVINAAKPGRAIVLTTHSMEEADVLGDTIAIMARGSVRALGTSLRLKQTYGGGYKLTVHVSAPSSGGASKAADAKALRARVQAVEQVFRQHLGLSAAGDVRRGLLQYLVPPGDDAQAALAAVLARLEAAGVADVQCSLASLEEVFLNIAKQAELEAAALSGSNLVCVELPQRDGGGSIMVPLAQEEVAHPTSGAVYAVKWSQDDQGRLVVLGCERKQQQQQQQQQQQREAGDSAGQCTAAAPPRAQPQQALQPLRQQDAAAASTSAAAPHEAAACADSAC